MMSATNSTLKGQCGNGERSERGACRSLDHLSVALERLGFVFSAVPGGSGLALAREAAFHRHLHGKPGTPILLIGRGV